MAVDLGLPRFLADAGPSRPTEIAAGVGADAEILAVFLHVLSAMGLVVHADDERYALDPEFAPVDAILRVLHARRDMRQKLEALTVAALRKGRITRWMDEREAHEVQHANWRNAITLMGIKQQRGFSGMVQFAAALGLDATRTLLDVGAGSGHYAAAFLVAYPTLRVIAADYAHVLPEIAATLERFSVADRATVLDAPFVSPDWLPPGGCDAVWYANTMHVTGIDENRALLAKLHDALEPGGKLIVYERARKTGSLVNAMNELTWSLGGTTRAYGKEDIRALVAEARFIDVEAREEADCVLLVGRKRT
jgi:precorrin-6B methylase 2